MSSTCSEEAATIRVLGNFEGSSVMSMSVATPLYNADVGRNESIISSPTLAELSLLKIKKKRARGQSALESLSDAKSSLSSDSSSAIETDSRYAEVVEDKCRKTTYQSFSKSKKGNAWGLEETRQFYGALRQCGTDFTVIQTLFPTRNRRQMKLKFMRFAICDEV